MLTIFEASSSHPPKTSAFLSLQTLQWSPSGKSLVAVIHHRDDTLLDLFIMSDQGTFIRSFNNDIDARLQGQDFHRDYVMLSWSPDESFILVAAWEISGDQSLDPDEQMASGVCALQDVATHKLIYAWPWTHDLAAGLPVEPAGALKVICCT